MSVGLLAQRTTRHRLSARLDLALLAGRTGAVVGAVVIGALLFSALVGAVGTHAAVAGMPRTGFVATISAQYASAGTTVATTHPTPGAAVPASTAAPDRSGGFDSSGGSDNSGGACDPAHDSSVTGCLPALITTAPLPVPPALSRSVANPSPGIVAGLRDAPGDHDSQAPPSLHALSISRT